MKFIISEIQNEHIFNEMYKFIVELIPVSTQLEFYSDEISEHTDYLMDDTEKIVAYIDDDYDSIFRIYMPIYWDSIMADNRKKIEESPILSLENEYSDKLNALFGEMWHEPMRKYIKDYFPELADIKIKTIE